MSMAMFNSELLNYQRVGHLLNHAESIWISWKTGRNVHELCLIPLIIHIKRDWPQRRFWPGTGDCDLAVERQKAQKAKSWAKYDKIADHWPMSLEASWGWCHYSPACLKAVATFLRCLLRKLQILGELCSQFPAIGDSQTWRLQNPSKWCPGCHQDCLGHFLQQAAPVKLLLDAVVAASKSNGIQNERHLNQERQWTNMNNI